MILLESYPCSACDKMRLAHLRFPHESQESDRTKATPGRPDLAASELRHMAKAREDISPSLVSEPPQVASKIVRRLAGARSEARRSSAMQIGGNRADMRCQSDQSPARDLGPGACRTPEQEHRADLGISPRTVDTIAAMRKTARGPSRR
jgi:hypothetical protein